MKRSLRSLQERKSTANDDYIYYGIANLKRAKKDETFMKPPANQKNAKEDSVKILEKKLIESKHENEALKETLHQMETENEKTIKLLRDDIEYLIHENGKLTSTVKDLKKENEILISLALADNLKISLEAPHASLEQVNEAADLFIWAKIDENNQYDIANLNLKKKSEDSKQFVEFIVKNVFEEDVENFIKESAKLIFTKNFFIKCVSFKHEKLRTCVKDTKILKCMEDAIKIRFGDDKVASDLTSFIRTTFYDFKHQLNRNPDLWIEM